MQKRQVEFQFKGARRYIQGPDLFNAMLDTGHPVEHLRNIRFIAHNFVNSPACEIYSTNAKEELAPLTEINARCQFDADGITYWTALKQLPAAGPEKRAEYDEESLIALCRCEGETISLTRQSPFSFIETLVSMNKHLHQQLFPEAAGKWIFTRIDLDAGSQETERLALHFRHNMNFRLTRSDILANGQKIGDLYFSLVKS